MGHKSTINAAVRCGLEITANARKELMKWSKDEHAFFSMQDAFDVHIEKRPIIDKAICRFQFSSIMERMKSYRNV